MKRFLVHLGLFFLPALVVVIGVNYTVDPASVFHDVETEIARKLASGHNVAVYVNYNERLMQKQLIELLPHTPSTLLLGSSRMLLLGRNYFGTRTHNLSVTGASLQDIIGIFYVYKQHRGFPDTVVIGVDPWFFNDFNEQHRWEALQREYNSFFGKQTSLSRPISLSRYAQLVSLSYFQSAVRMAFSPDADKKRIVTTPQKCNGTITRLPDGTICYEPYRRNRNAEQRRHAAEAYIAAKLYGIESFEQLSQTRQQEFELFAQRVQSGGSTLILLLLPYNPIVWEYVENTPRYHAVLRSQAYIKTVARNLNITLWGDYIPAQCSVGVEDFYDGIHLSEKGVEKVMALHGRNKKE